jgi:hypothetical protein
VPLQVEGIHLLIGDLDAGSVVLSNKVRLDFEPSLGFRLPNIVQSEIKRA